MAEQIGLIPMTQDEYMAKSRELADLVRELAVLEGEHAAARKAMREERMLLLASLNEAARVIRERGVRGAG